MDPIHVQLWSLARCFCIGITEQFELADQSLFAFVQTNCIHELYSLLPTKSSEPYNLRSRIHNFLLSSSVRKHPTVTIDNPCAI